MKSRFKIITIVLFISLPLTGKCVHEQRNYDLEIIRMTWGTSENPFEIKKSCLYNDSLFNFSITWPFSNNKDMVNGQFKVHKIALNNGRLLEPATVDFNIPSLSKFKEYASSLYDIFINENGMFLIFPYFISQHDFDGRFIKHVMVQNDVKKRFFAFTEHNNKFYTIEDSAGHTLTIIDKPGNKIIRKFKVAFPGVPILNEFRLIVDKEENVHVMTNGIYNCYSNEGTLIKHLGYSSDRIIDFSLDQNNRLFLLMGYNYLFERHPYLPNEITSKIKHLYFDVISLNKNGTIGFRLGSTGWEKGQFQEPSSLFEHNGNLIVIDKGNRRIQIFKNFKDQSTAKLNYSIQPLYVTKLYKKEDGSSDRFLDVPIDIINNNDTIKVIYAFDKHKIIQLFDQDFRFLKEINIVNENISKSAFNKIINWITNTGEQFSIQIKGKNVLCLISNASKEENIWNLAETNTIEAIKIESKNNLLYVVDQINILVYSLAPSL